jgi:hypothetical protein
MTGPAMRDTADPGIESYLAEVAAGLPGLRRSSGAIIAELRAGLLDAVDGYCSVGLTPAEAAVAAIREFGAPAMIAAAFRPELAARSARRTALSLVVTGPVVGLLWISAGAASHIGFRHAPPWEWVGAPPGSSVALPLAFAVLAATIVTALLAVAATGRLTRWLPDRPRLAPVTAAFAGFGFAVVDMIVLALAGSELISAPGVVAPVPVAVAAAVSLTRIMLARRAASRCLRVLA